MKQSRPSVYISFHSETSGFSHWTLKTAIPSPFSICFPLLPLSSLFPNPSFLLSQNAYYCHVPHLAVHTFLQMENASKLPRNLKKKSTTQKIYLKALPISSFGEKGKKVRQKCEWKLFFMWGKGLLNCALILLFSLYPQLFIKMVFPFTFFTYII